MRQTSIAFLLLILFSTPFTSQAEEGERTGFSMERANAEAVWQTIHDSVADVVLVNLWATWCQPCREEMPDLLKLQREYGSEGFQLLLVSADFLRNQQQAEEYLKGLGVDFPTLLKDQKDMEFIDGLNKEWSGALPFSMLVKKDGSIIKTWEGKGSYEDFQNVILPLLRTTEEE